MINRLLVEDRLNLIVDYIAELFSHPYLLTVIDYPLMLRFRL